MQVSISIIVIFLPCLWMSLSLSRHNRAPSKCLQRTIVDQLSPSLYQLTLSLCRHSSSLLWYSLSLCQVSPSIPRPHASILIYGFDPQRFGVGKGRQVESLFYKIPSYTDQACSDATLFSLSGRSSLLHFVFFIFIWTRVQEIQPFWAYIIPLH
jgi:hypothetical protein